MVPAPPPSRPATAASTAEGGAAAGEADGEVADAKGAEAEEGDGEGEGGELKMVKKHTKVGSAVVKLGSLVTGTQTELSAPVTFVPGPAMFGEVGGLWRTSSRLTLNLL